MKMDSDNPVMALVVERESRRVIDCAKLSYSWSIDELLANHDLDKVDVVLRSPTLSQNIPTEVEEPPAPTISSPADDDDVPF
jgi:hypothetical protein